MTMAHQCRSVAAALVLLMVTGAVNCYESFQSRLPNGRNVPHPCNPNELWKGVGHFNVDGGGHRNPFGADFNAAGNSWTAELCGQDSDGDGKTNGEELGDPDCTWQPGGVPKFTSGLSHPGVCEPLDSEVCQQKAFDVGVFRVQEEWMAEACKRAGFECPGLTDPDTKNMTLQFPRTPVPAQETTYECAIFRLDKILGEDVHIIATAPVLDNRQVMHHIVLFGCKGDVSKMPLETPYQCGMLPHANCSNIISVWTLGQNGECFHPSTGVRLGLRGYTHLALQFHWNNPEKTDNMTDSSGMTLYYTANLRPNDAAVLLIGNEDFVIPPRQSEVMVQSDCSSTCTRNLMNKPFNITAAWNHMHYLGIKQQIEHIRNGQRLRYITNDATYSYDSPKTHTYSTPIEVLPGDELKTTCYFSSESRTKSTIWGESTQQEMCYGFLYYYPENALKTPFCTSTGDMAFCDEDSLRGCDFGLFYQHLREYLYDAIVGNCTNNGYCYQECKAAIREAQRSEPCMRYIKSWERIKHSLSTYDTVFLGSIASCEAEMIRESFECPGPTGTSSVISAGLLGLLLPLTAMFWM